MVYLYAAFSHEYVQTPIALRFLYFKVIRVLSVFIPKINDIVTLVIGIQNKWSARVDNFFQILWESRLKRIKLFVLAEKGSVRFWSKENLTFLNLVEKETFLVENDLAHIGVGTYVPLIPLIFNDLLCQPCVRPVMF